jgi:hypothetical protein
VNAPEFFYGSDPWGLGDLARPDAPGAYFDVFRRAVHHRAHTLDIRLPSPFDHVVGVRDIASGHRAFAADFTSLRHFRIPPRGPRWGVELNSTRDSVLQVRASLRAPFSCHLGRARGDRNAK